MERSRLYKFIPTWSQSFAGFLMVLLLSCIEQLDIITEEERNLLVVEGHITTGEGPHTILLSKSAKYGDVFQGVVRKEENAIVRIRNESGEQVFLEEFIGGRYQTPAGFEAEVGSTYTLLITTRDGNEYISQPETIIQAPKIDSLILRYRVIPGDVPGNFRSGVEVFSQWTDPEGDKNFYLWRNTGTYLINTRPDLFTIPDGNGGSIAAPKDCCAICWVTEEDGDNSVRLFSDRRSNGGVNTEQVAFIEDDGGRFMDKYLVRIEQQSISGEAFQFFELLQNQLSIDGDIFDPPPATIRGNMINLTDPQSPVIGYFRASDVAVDSVFIPGSLLLDTQLPRQVNNDCRVLPGSTSEPPSYWFD